MVPGDTRGPNIADTFNKVAAKMACDAETTTRGCLTDRR
jgi:hypothetical protein